MTDTTGNPAMPAALATILQEPGWDRYWEVNRFEQRTPNGWAYIVIQWSMASGWEATLVGKHRTVPGNEVVFAGSLIARVQAALVPDGPDQGGA